tara:strand:- start:885 stop:1169 length:285 start_codon:yes stop_codon:yes gene_type:complete
MPNIDRSPDEMPTKTMFARMTGYHPSATPRYNDAAKMGSSPIERALTGDQKTLPEFLQKEILAAESSSKKSKDDTPITRRMKFCGGMSNPYGKK